MSEQLTSKTRSIEELLQALRFAGNPDCWEAVDVIAQLQLAVTAAHADRTRELGQMRQDFAGVVEEAARLRAALEKIVALEDRQATIAGTIACKALAGDIPEYTGPRYWPKLGNSQRDPCGSCGKPLDAHNVLQGWACPSVETEPEHD